LRSDDRLTVERRSENGIRRGAVLCFDFLRKKRAHAKSNNNNLTAELFTGCADPSA
jgi:hypothetical protein